MNAISFEEREAPAYNEAAVLAAKQAKSGPRSVPGQLMNFPVQIKLLPINSSAICSMSSSSA